jgi:hypothetical protein
VKEGSTLQDASVEVAQPLLAVHGVKHAQDADNVQALTPHRQEGLCYFLAQPERSKSSFIEEAIGSEELTATRRKAMQSIGRHIVAIGLLFSLGSIS